MAFWNRNKVQEDDVGVKKRGLFRKLGQTVKGIDWSNPTTRWKLLFAGLVTFLVLIGFVGGAIAYTSTQSFCKVCHEMSAEYATTKASAHSEISCIQCHIPPGPVNLVVHKMESLKEVYYHIMGPPDPIVQTVGVLDENCTQCHSDNRLVTARGDLIVEHEKHIKKNIPCITCHSGVAHAKVVERGINDSSTYDHWTAENAKKLVGKEYMAPNMGTCIDCHNKVNHGEEPWKDEAYSLPDNPHKEGEGDKKETEASAGKVSHQNTQDIILQALGKGPSDLKLSMECRTCHKEISTPKDHETKEWNQNHGMKALKNLNQCITCHTDTKWVKKFAKQDMKELLYGEKEKDKYSPNYTVVKNLSRQNQFCSTCHADRPRHHLDSDTWLKAHANQAQTNEQKAKCYICHDKEKPTGTEVKAPTDVYCQFCHRTGFKEG